jgi:hypothetical protein
MVTIGESGSTSAKPGRLDVLGVLGLRRRWQLHTIGDLDLILGPDQMQNGDVGKDEGRDALLGQTSDQRIDLSIGGIFGIIIPDLLVDSDQVLADLVDDRLRERRGTLLPGAGLDPVGHLPGQPRRPQRSVTDVHLGRVPDLPTLQAEDPPRVLLVDGLTERTGRAWVHPPRGDHLDNVQPVVRVEELAAAVDESRKTAGALVQQPLGLFSGLRLALLVEERSLELNSEGGFELAVAGGTRLQWVSGQLRDQLLKVRFGQASILELAYELDLGERQRLPFGGSAELPLAALAEEYQKGRRRALAPLTPAKNARLGVDPLRLEDRLPVEQHDPGIARSQALDQLLAPAVAGLEDVPIAKHLEGLRAVGILVVAQPLNEVAEELAMFLDHELGTISRTDVGAVADEDRDRHRPSAAFRAY